MGQQNEAWASNVLKTAGERFVLPNKERAHRLSVNERDFTTLFMLSALRE
jgi:hypothetical protein